MRTCIVIAALVAWGVLAHGADVLIFSPQTQPAPVGRSSLTPEQIRAYEQAKLTRSPLTRTDPAKMLGSASVQQQQANEATNGQCEKKEAIQCDAVLPKGYAFGSATAAPLWAMDDTVFTGALEYRYGYTPVKQLSFDCDSAGTFYATVDSQGGSGPGKLMYSTDEGHTWHIRTNAYPNCCSKVITVDADSSYIYWFIADTSSKAYVFRWNKSPGGILNLYMLRTDSVSRIDAAWDLDRINPFFHVVLELQNGDIQYVRGTNNGKTWSTPSTIDHNIHYSCIACGNIGQVSNNIFIAGTWSVDSSAYVWYDSVNVWKWQKIGGANNRKDIETAIAASHGQYGDSVRVWITHTHYYNGTDPDINISYNLNNGQGTWQKEFSIPNANSGRSEHCSSLNIPNRADCSGFVNLCYFSDSGNTYRVQHNWLADGWAHPTVWSGTTIVSNNTHSNFIAPYATGAYRRSTGTVGSVVLYGGSGPANVYFDATWRSAGVSENPRCPSSPAICHLEQNSPNPFRSLTTIRYQIAAPGHVKLAIYNINGQLVQTLVDGYRQPGSYSAAWNAGAMANGVYLCRLCNGNRSLTRRMTLVK